MALTDKPLVCRDCGREFTFTVGEQLAYSSRGLLNEHSAWIFVKPLIVRRLQPSYENIHRTQLSFF